MNAEKILAALAGNASYSFEFDVTAGIVENDIIGKSGINYTYISRTFLALLV